MRLAYFRIILTIISLIALCISVSASTVSSGFSDKTSVSNNETNSVRVRCYMDEKVFKLSVASVLRSNLSDRKSDKLDIALTTGHGLVGADGNVIEECYIYEPTGRKKKVHAIIMAPNYKEASSTDWAVLVFDRIKARKLVRYSVDPSLSSLKFEQLANSRAEVKFSKARGILENLQHCNLFPRLNANLADSRFNGIVPHSCKSIGGQSGSPVSVAGIASEIVIGIHLGESFSLPIENVTDRAQWVGFMRIIDNAFLVELEAIVSELESSY